MCGIIKQYYVMKDLDILNSTLLITYTINKKRVHLISMAIPDSKVQGANMGPTLVLSAPDGPHAGPLNIAIWGVTSKVVPRWYGLHIITTATMS